MAKFQHQASVLARWLSAGRTQLALAKAAEINQPALSRAFAGDSRPEPETMGKILGVVAGEDPDLAADLLEAYLLDGIPEGEAPDGLAWVDHVKIHITALAAARVREDEPKADEFEEALAYINKVARTNVNARAIVLGFYRIRHRPGVRYDGKK